MIEMPNTAPVKLPPALPPPAPEPSRETAQLLDQLRRSMGHSPQVDRAIGQLISLLA